MAYASTYPRPESKSRSMTQLLGLTVSRVNSKIHISIINKPYSQFSSNTLSLQNSLHLDISSLVRFLWSILTAISNVNKKQAIAEGLHNARASWNLVNCYNMFNDLHLKSPATSVWGFKVIKNGTWHFLLMVCHKNVCVLHHFWHTTTFTVYMCAQEWPWPWEVFQFCYKSWN